MNTFKLKIHLLATIVIISFLSSSITHADIIAPSVTDSVNDAAVIVTPPIITNTTDIGANVISILPAPTTTPATTANSDNGATLILNPSIIIIPATTTPTISTSTDIGATVISIPPTTSTSTDNGATIIQNPPSVIGGTDSNGGATIIIPITTVPVTAEPIVIISGGSSNISGGGSSSSNYSYPLVLQTNNQDISAVGY